ncbi:putative HVA22-like protein g isoform X2 [Magnolia sinica]|uniref:putative HVA22-like protein g isoform X2 n=1 Tax=Magnolia sinica TaxID=86752 RepID=UPI002657FE1C|nr:putative HVA22-like protein g isoform X2 [Magnolia sinica]
MLGDVITRSLVLLLGYVYPAYECFKTVEKNRADIEQLRFWCQYWVPMYGELKLAFIVYLWHPKTKGTDYVYETFLQPYLTKHETEIDRKLLEVKARAWDMALLYLQNVTSQGQSKFFEFLQYLAKQSARPTTATQSAEPVPQSPNSKASVNCQKEPQIQKTTGQWQPPPTAPPTTIMRQAPQAPKADYVLQTQMTIRREVSQTPIADHVVQTPVAEATTSRVEVGIEPSKSIASGANDQIQDITMDETLRAARVRLRRANTSRIET